MCDTRQVSLTFCVVDPGDNAELSMFVTCLAAQIVNKTGGFVLKDVLRLLLGCKRSLALCILLRAEALAVVGKEERWREGGRERERVFLTLIQPYRFYQGKTIHPFTGESPFYCYDTVNSCFTFEDVCEKLQLNKH